MRILLDENVPRPLVELVRHLLSRHHVVHVAEIGWSGKPDVDLLRDASGRYDVFLTNDVNQYNDPSECRAIRRSGLHHVTYAIPKSGLDGLALASGAISAGIIGLVEALEGEGHQRVARIVMIGRGARFEIKDPQRDPPSNYW